MAVVAAECVMAGFVLPKRPPTALLGEDADTDSTHPSIVVLPASIAIKHAIWYR